jgi:LysM repeat protein
MPKSISSISGDSLLSLAQEHLGDASQWRSLADLNNINPLQLLEVGQQLGIPLNSELIQQALPILSSIAGGRNGEAGLQAILGQVTSAIGQYSPEAQALLGEINGAIGGDVESVAQGLAQKILGQGLRGYDQSGVQLIDWLLNSSGGG